MVDYFYTGNYQNKASDEADKVHVIVVHVTMFGLADMYLIDGLLALAQTKFSQAVKAERMVSVLFLHVKRVYDLQCDSSEVLREIMVEQLRERIPGMDESKQPLMKSLFQEIPEFASDIATSFVRKPLTPKTGHCSKCDCAAERAKEQAKARVKRLSERRWAINT